MSVAFTSDLLGNTSSIIYQCLTYIQYTTLYNPLDKWLCTADWERDMLDQILRHLRHMQIRQE